VSKELLGAVQENAAARVAVVSAGDMAVPLQCRHCEDAPCVLVCPTGALKKPVTQGPVTLDDQLCIGCKSCILVCPFGVINLGQKRKAIIKCDLCIERLEEGLQPACVEACPTGALRFGKLEEFMMEARRRAAQQMKETVQSHAATGLVVEAPFTTGDSEEG
jgi:carbon-monoxide dehydrogenase iron sulfur subunit